MNHLDHVECTIVVYRTLVQSDSGPAQINIYPVCPASQHEWSLNGNKYYVNISIGLLLVHCCQQNKYTDRNIVRERDSHKHKRTQYEHIAFFIRWNNNAYYEFCAHHFGVCSLCAKLSIVAIYCVNKTDVPNYR